MNDINEDNAWTAWLEAHKDKEAGPKPGGLARVMSWGGKRLVAAFRKAKRVFGRVMSKTAATPQKTGRQRHVSPGQVRGITMQGRGERR